MTPANQTDNTDNTTSPCDGNDDCSNPGQNGTGSAKPCHNAPYGQEECQSAELGNGNDQAKPGKTIASPSGDSTDHNEVNDTDQSCGSAHHLVPDSHHTETCPTQDSKAATGAPSTIQATGVPVASRREKTQKKSRSCLSEHRRLKRKREREKHRRDVFSHSFVKLLHVLIKVDPDFRADAVTREEQRKARLENDATNNSVPPNVDKPTGTADAVATTNAGGHGGSLSSGHATTAVTATAPAAAPVSVRLEDSTEPLDFSRTELVVRASETLNALFAKIAMLEEQAIGTQRVLSGCQERFCEIVRGDAATTTNQESPLGAFQNLAQMNGMNTATSSATRGFPTESGHTAPVPNGHPRATTEFHLSPSGQTLPMSGSTSIPGPFAIGTTAAEKSIAASATSSLPPMERLRLLVSLSEQQQHAHSGTLPARPPVSPGETLASLVSDNLSLPRSHMHTARQPELWNELLRPLVTDHTFQHRLRQQDHARAARLNSALPSTNTDSRFPATINPEAMVELMKAQQRTEAHLAMAAITNPETIQPKPVLRFHRVRQLDLPSEGQGLPAQIRHAPFNGHTTPQPIGTHTTNPIAALLQQTDQSMFAPGKCSGAATLATPTVTTSAAEATRGTHVPFASARKPPPFSSAEEPLSSSPLFDTNAKKARFM